MWTHVSRKTTRAAAAVAAASMIVSFAPLGAEPTPDLKPGDGRIEGSTIEPFCAVGDRVHQEVTLGKVEGTPVINALYQVTLPSGELLVDHIVVDRAGLGLIFRFAPYFAVGQDYLVATLRGNELGGSLNPLTGGEPRPIAKTLDSAVFEESILGLLLATLPLEESFAATIPRLAISGSTQSFLAGTIALEVTGRERIKGRDNKHYETWVVEARWGGVDYRERLWIAGEPPYMIQKVSTFPNGNTRTSTFGLAKRCGG